MLKKCASKRGMTLMELLCAIAILALLGAAVAFALPSTVRTYNNVTSGSEASVLCSTLSEAVAEELRFASDIKLLSDGSVNYNSQRFGTRIKLSFINVKDDIYIAAESGEGADKKQFPLISYAAYTSGLRLNTDNNASRIVYIPEKKLFYVALTVYNAQTKKNVWNEFYVRPLNPPQNLDAS